MELAKENIQYPFQPTVEALEYALKIQVERNMELQSMLRECNLANRSLSDVSLSCYCLESFIPSFRQILESSTEREVSGFLTDTNSLLEDFLNETRLLPQDARHSSVEKLEEDKYAVLYHRDVVWFLEEIISQFNEIKKAYGSEKQAIKTMKNQFVELISILEKQLKKDTSKENERYPCISSTEYHRLQELVKEKDVYASTLEGMLLCLQEKLMNNGLPNLHSLSTPDSVSNQFDKGEKNISTNVSPTDRRFRSVFNKMQHTIAKQGQEIETLRRQLTDNQVELKANDRHGERSSDKLQDSENISTLKGDAQVELVKLQKDYERLKICKLKQEEQYRLQEEASRIRLRYLERMVRLLESKTEDTTGNSSYTDRLVTSLDRNTPSKAFSDASRSETSLLSPNPKFFTFSRFPKTPAV